MSMKQITVKINELILGPAQEYAAEFDLSLDFVVGVALDQFLADPDNRQVYTYKDGRKIPILPPAKKAGRLSADEYGHLGDG